MPRGKKFTVEQIAGKLREAEVELARMMPLLRAEGWWVNHKRVERIWRQEGLTVPAKQPKRRRLWLGDGSCIRFRPTHRNHVWSYDFVMDRTADGRTFRMLSKRTGAIPRQGYPGDRDWFHQWGQVTCLSKYRGDPSGCRGF